MQRQNRIRELRKEKGWSRMRLIEAANISWLSASLYECANRFPAEPIRARICKALGRTEAEIWPVMPEAART